MSSEYAAIWPHWRGAERLAELPYLHAAVFKHLSLRTQGEDIRYQR